MSDGDRYRDAGLPVNERVDDLLERMTLAEKAALLFQTSIVVGEDGTLSDGEPGLGVASTEHLIGELGLTHLNLIGAADDSRTLARWHNRLQERARATRLGVPITLATDPRHHFTNNPAVAALAGAFSQWPEPLGLAALRSPELAGRFADIVRREYAAVGIRAAIHPDVDVATEPRWARIAATFGEDAELVAALGAAYIRGLQGDTLGPSSIAATAKHFPGGGPQKDGEDPHFASGREQIYPGGRFEYHLLPFRAAVAAGAAHIMPYYGMPVGTEYEEVGFGYNRGVVTGLLRNALGFDGVVLTDWGLVSESTMMGERVPARAWGAEELDALSRVEKILAAGCDQLGGESRPELVVELVLTGRVSEERVDRSARRLLREKFVLGLFDDPFVDEDRAVQIVGSPDFRALGELVQRRSYTLLVNRDDLLPLHRGLRLYVEGIDPALAARYAQVVDDPALADVALVRLTTPHEPREGFFEGGFHSGSLAFSDKEKARHAAMFQTVPTVVVLALERPAVIPEIVATAAAVLAEYGSADAACLDVAFGVVAPEGQLPVDLPSSMTAVGNSSPDAPFDTAAPTLHYGHGLRYTRDGDPVPNAPDSPVRSIVSGAVPESLNPAPRSDDVSGHWLLDVETPRGLQRVALTLRRDADRVEGDLEDTAVTDASFSDGRLEFRATLTRPFPVKVRVRATVNGDRIQGTAKASMLPVGLRFTGTRA